MKSDKPFIIVLFSKIIQLAIILIIMLVINLIRNTYDISQYAYETIPVIIYLFIMSLYELFARKPVVITCDIVNTYSDDYTCIHKSNNVPENQRTLNIKIKIFLKNYKVKSYFYVKRMKKKVYLYITPMTKDSNLSIQALKYDETVTSVKNGFKIDLTDFIKSSMINCNEFSNPVLIKNCKCVISRNREITMTSPYEKVLHSIYINRKQLTWFHSNSFIENPANCSTHQIKIIG